MTKKVDILLSTYNGEKYLEELFASLTNQNYSNITIRIRDDGSQDSTNFLIETFSLNHKNVIYEHGVNLGVALSFFKLLESSNDSDYIALCDQDDVWLPNKVEKAVHVLDNMDPKIPALFFSRLEFVDSQLNNIGFSRIPRKIGFGNALVQNIATGCLILINKAARDILIKFCPRNCVMHDAWFYLVISAFGVVVYDSEFLLKYRLHGNNVIGAKHSLISTMAGRYLRIFNRGDYFLFHDQALEFKKLYGDLLSESNLFLLNLFIDAKYNLRSRIKLVISNKIWKQRCIDNIFLRILISCNKY